MIWQCLGCSAKAAKGRFSSAFTFKTTFTFEKSQDLFFFWLALTYPKRPPCRDRSLVMPGISWYVNLQQGKDQ